MCWLWSNMKSVMWGAIEDISAGNKAPCQAQHSRICRCSAGSSRCGAGVESSRAVGSLRSRKSWGSSPGCWKSPVLTLTSKSARLVPKSSGSKEFLHVQETGRVRVRCYRRWCFHSCSEECVLSMPIICWTPQLHPKLYINNYVILY